MNKLRIKEEFIKWDELKILSFIFNKKNDFQIKKITNSSMYMESVINKDKYYNDIINEFNKYPWYNTVKNIDITSIIRKSPYEPFSFWFIKDFFSNVFDDSNILDKFKFKRPWRTSAGKSSVAYIYKKSLFVFLKNYTNIEEISEKFIKEINSIDKIKFIENYWDVQLYKLIYFYIKQDKNKKNMIDSEIDFLPIDNKFLFFQRWKQMKSLSYRNLIYYSTSFKEGSTLFT